MPREKKAPNAFKWKKKYCEMLVDHMAKGLSIEAFAGEIGVTRNCVYKWRERHECFEKAFEQGKAKQHLFFEKMGIHAMAGKIKNFPASTYIFTMKNKLGWKDKVEVDNNGSININIDDDDAGL